MRFIHLADVHFDMPFTLLSERNNLGDLRRIEQRKIFKNVIEYIKKENIKYLFISGDLYEQNYVRETTIEFINEEFKKIPNAKIFISPGNHDPFLKNSYYNNYNWNENVYIFNSEIKKYEFDEVDIYGYGFNNFYSKTINTNIEIKNKNKLNILITHADINASKISEEIYNPISQVELNNMGFDYVALGHIHKKCIFDKNIVYPGSLVAEGFDELGEHGMMDVNLSKEKTDINFIKTDERVFEELNLDISEINSEEELIEKIQDLKLEEDYLYKIILIGNKNFEININKIIKLNINEKIIKIKDETKINYNLDELKKQNNIKGMFVREILNSDNINNYSEAEIQKALEIGLNILD